MVWPRVRHPQSSSPPPPPPSSAHHTPISTPPFRRCQPRSRSCAASQPNCSTYLPSIGCSPPFHPPPPTRALRVDTALTPEKQLTSAREVAHMVPLGDHSVTCGTFIACCQAPRRCALLTKIISRPPPLLSPAVGGLSVWAAKRSLFDAPHWTATLFSTGHPLWLMPQGKTVSLVQFETMCWWERAATQPQQKCSRCATSYLKCGPCLFYVAV